MSELLYSVQNSIATMTINRPERRNALSATVISQLIARLGEADADKSVRVVVITGSGGRAFCSGADLEGGVGGRGTEQYANLIKRIADYPKPTVARVNGYCLAGGMGLMLACDIVIAHEQVQFGTPEINVGIWPMMISALIYRNMLPKQAMKMMLLGERFGASQALEMGFVSQITLIDLLDETVKLIAEKLAAKSSISIKMGKEAYQVMQDMPLSDALDYLSNQLSKVAATQDAQEGILAFMEKRKPRFIGS